MNRVVLRHAKPLIGAGVCYGALDVPADLLATQACAQAVAPLLPANFSARVSPLQRCRQLASSIAALRSDGVFTLDIRLAEMDFGIWEGCAWADIPRAAVDAWVADFAQHRFGGKESVSDVMCRVAAAWDELPAAELWVTHAGVARAATLIARGSRILQNADQWPLTAPAFGEWVTLAA